MPLIKQRDYPGGVTALWGTTETVPELEALCTADEVAAARQMKPKRAAGFLSWRALLHAVTPETVVAYDADGGPVVVSGRYPYIGVSHTNGYAALILGYRPCAVDIESFGRNITELAGKFSTTGDTQALEFLPAEKRLTVVWCIKESLYKLHRQYGIDFKRDMQVLSGEYIDGSTGVIRARFVDQHNDLYLRQYENLCMVFVWK